MAESGNIGKRGCEEDAAKNDEQQLCLLFDWTDDVSMMGFFSLVNTCTILAKISENVSRSDAFINFTIACLKSVRKDVVPNFFLTFCNNQIIGGRQKGCRTPILEGKETPSS